MEQKLLDKPKFISHRGNLNGPNPETENTIKSIFTALGKGYDVEIDIWVIDDIIYFGHDEPQRLIDQFILDKIGLRGWFHCKNLEAIYFLNKNYPNFNYFWHQNDDYTLTSSGYIWTFPGKKYNKKCIVVDLNKEVKNYKQCYGVCSDYII